MPCPFMQRLGLRPLGGEDMFGIGQGGVDGLHGTQLTD
jgi:hypothetical protein